MSRDRQVQAVAADDPIEPWVWRIAVVVVLGSILPILDTTIVNIALARLGVVFGKTVATTQWVVTGYTLALGAVIPLTGWMARRFGTRRAYVFSLLLFTAASALCGTAQSLGELVAFRVVQGLAGGMIMPLGQIQIANAAGPKRMGRVLSMTMAPAMIAPIVGPVLGGFIVDGASWRWIFYVNVPIGIGAAVAAMRMLPNGGREHGRALDIRGFVLLVSGIPLVTYGLAQGGTTGAIMTSKVLVPAFAGLALIGLFIAHALRTENPLLDLRLYKRPAFLSASMSLFCLMAALFGTMILMPLYWQNVRHLSAARTGLLLAPEALAYGLALPFSTKVAARFGGSRVSLLGIAGVTFSTLPFTFLGARTPIAPVVLATVVQSVFWAFAWMPMIAAAYAALTRSELSDAPPQINVLNRLSSSLGVAVLAVVLQRGLSHAGDVQSAARAFDHAFWWTVGLPAVAAAPAVVLLRAQRSAPFAGPDSAPPSESQAAVAEAAT